MKFNLIELATKVMLGVPYQKPDKSLVRTRSCGRKSTSVLVPPLAECRSCLGVDMSSTGEVACLGDNFYEAILKSMLSVGYTIPKEKHPDFIGSGTFEGRIAESCQNAC
jgi:carbamoyl-phosphate synthase large subunit